VTWLTIVLSRCDVLFIAKSKSCYCLVAKFFAFRRRQNDITAGRKVGRFLRHGVVSASVVCVLFGDNIKLLSKLNVYCCVYFSDVWNC